MMTANSWQIGLIAGGMVLAGLASYTTSRIGLAEELGDRPTRAEVNDHVQELKEIIIREVAEIKEQQKDDAKFYQAQQGEVRQDIRRLTDFIIEKMK